ncbi:MAG: NAD(P)/FAD-dependent oxidoreductase [Acidimicrobiales bacterium]
MSRYAVAGAGLTGALLAARLGQAGHDVTVHERRDDPRRGPRGEGRSINLALSTRGLDALERVGLADHVRARAVPMRARLIHAVDGTLTRQPYGTTPAEHLLSVDRDELGVTLIDLADASPRTQLRFAERVHGIDLTSDSGRVGYGVAAADAGSHHADALFAADGAFSGVRRDLADRGLMVDEVTAISHGYKELTIAAGTDGTHRLEPEVLHIWPRGTHMLIALPNTDGSFTATLFWPHEGPVSFGSVTPADVTRVFAELFADAAQAIGDDLAEQYEANPASGLVSVRTAPWNVDDRVVLVGDAAHAVVPFYGQGANAALEDVTLLCDLLADGGRGDAFTAFSRRRVDTDALASLAMDNFVEMRDHVGSRWFLVLAALRRMAHRLAPRYYVPLYTMVTFTRIPYSRARRRARRQDALAVTAATVLCAAVTAVIVAVVRR